MHINETIIEEVFEGTSPSKDIPFYALASGGPASHKCFFGDWLKKNGWDGFLTIDESVEKFLHTGEEALYPHGEKSPNSISAYYDFIEALIHEAAKRNVSIILEDHGDYPDIYKDHINFVTPYGYESFVVGTTITEPNFNKKTQHLMDNEGMPDFTDWGKLYHKRLAQRFDKLTDTFPKGILVETQPDYISPDGEPHERLVLCFEQNEKKLITRVPNSELHNTYYRWERNKTQASSVINHFNSVDKAMELRPSSEGLTHPPGICRPMNSTNNISAFHSFQKHMRALERTYSKEPLFEGYVYIVPN